MLFGWAAEPYKESAFFWESVNAATIVSTVAVTEVMGGPSRTTAHIIIFSVALVLQIVVRPFDDFHANVSVTLFALCELFGALGELRVPAFQWIYVLTFLFALVVTGKFAVSALVKRVKQQREHVAAAVDVVDHLVQVGEVGDALIVQLQHHVADAQSAALVTRGHRVE